MLRDQGKKKYAESIYEFACKSQNVLLCALRIGLAFLLLITGFAISPVVKAAGAPSAESFVVYAAPDGLYTTDLTTNSSKKRFDGEKLSRPVLSKNGDMVLFRQYDKEPKGTSAPNCSSCYGYAFGANQSIRLKEAVQFYCAGPEDTFIVSTTDGKLLKVKLQTVRHDGAEVLQYQTENISVWPESVPQDSDISVSYANLECSPDDRYLAYNVDVQDNRTPSQSGLNARPLCYNGGLYVLDFQSGKAVTVVPPKQPTATDLGADPAPGPWSPDGKVLIVWDKPQSASLNADGVSAILYHMDTGMKTGFKKPLLGYNENVSFSSVGSAAVLSGNGRDMFLNKEIDLITDYSKDQAESHKITSISDNNLIPAMPQLSADGKTLYFAAVNKADVKDYEKTYPLKRQLYALQIQTGEVRQITADTTYRNENPVLRKDEAHLIFGRANAEAFDGKMELWMIDLQNGKENKLAEWTEPKPYDSWMLEKYNDFYGRGNWDGMFAFYDGSKSGK